MPTEVPPPPSPEPFDPEKTLFFKRRKKVKLLPLIVGCVLVLGTGVLIVWAITQPSKPAPEEVTDSTYREASTPRSAVAPTAVGTGSKLATVPPPRALPVDTPVPPKALPVNPPPPSSNATIASEEPPSMPDANAPLNLDVKDPGNAQVRDEVLRRIDLMPGVSASNKDKLYASVDHARSMGRVLTIPFVKGETAIHAADVERLRQQLASPAIQQMVDDPTVVFVVLGYADPKGSDKVNSEISLSRARSVLDALRDKCGLQNVMHAVAMGGSTLFSTQQAEKNRVVEVWAVLP